MRRASKKRLLKIVVYVAKQDKIAVEKPGKSKQLKVARVELKAAGDPHMPEKPEWSAYGIKM